MPSPQWLGRLGYRWALRLQRSRRAAILEGRAPEALWLLEHPPVITMGRRGGEVRGAPGGVEVVPVERGGLATVHVPGQLIAYGLIDLGGRGLGVRAYVRALEAGVIAYLATVGIGAGRATGRPGVWVGEAKIAAVGIHVRRGVTLHGVALNLSPDLAAFDWIIPCGLPDASVTSVAALRAEQLLPHHEASAFGHHLRAAIVDTLRRGG